MKRIEEINFARVVAMLSVIMIHVTSTYINYESKYLFLGMNLGFILNQISRFAVPLFIIISGISLGLGSGINSPVLFYQKRAVKIGLPYLFWYVVYFLYHNHLNFTEMLRGGAKDIFPFFQGLILGQVGPHLYFIAIIFQCYLIYPILKEKVRKSPWSSLLIAFIISYTVQKLFFFLRFGVDLIPQWIEPYLWLLLPTWIFYFILGLVLTPERLMNLRYFAEKNVASILCIAAVFSIIYMIEARITGDFDSIKASLNVFTLLVLLSLFGIWHFLGENLLVQRIINYLARHSMTVYFEHVLVLSFFRRFAIFSKGMIGMLLLYAVVTVGSVGFAVLIHVGVEEMKKVIMKKRISP